MSQENVDHLFNRFERAREPSDVDVILAEAGMLNGDEKKSFTLQIQQVICKDSIDGTIDGFNADAKMQSEFASVALMSAAEREAFKF
jgi:hypothetical protein